MRVKEILKRYEALRSIYRLAQSMRQFICFNPFMLLKRYSWFLKQYIEFKQEPNLNFEEIELYPCLTDNINYTPVDPVYFYQDTWFAAKIFKLKPRLHVDIGSSLKTIGIISQYIPTLMVDIRPPKVRLPNLYFIKGDILRLPFKDRSLESVSSLCVVEHIGLGRYGDKINPFGSEKAIEELKRIVKIGGVLLISVPVDRKNKVYFNAHRAFTREYVLMLFEDNFVLEEERYQYGFDVFHNYDPTKGFGTGFYMFRRVK